MSKNVNLIKKLVKEELKSRLSEGLENMNLTDSEIGLLVAIYNKYSDEGPVADKKTYKYIQPDYAKEVVNQYIQDPNITSNGKLLAKNILNKFGTTNLKEDSDFARNYYSNEIRQFMSASDKTTPYKPQIKLHWGGDNGEANTKWLSVDWQFIDGVLKLAEMMQNRISNEKSLNNMKKPE